MLHAHERVTRAAHRVTRFEQRLVEALAVVCDQDVEAGEISGERMEHGRLLVVIPHEELAHAKAMLIDAADADEERIGAGTSGEAGGFGIEKGPGGGMGARDGSGGEGIEEIVRQLDQVGYFVTAVA